MRRAHAPITWTLAVALLAGLGCGDEPADADGGSPDAARVDAGDGDAGERDAGEGDAGGDPTTDAGARDAGAGGPSYAEVVFRSTHNSYSGGPRGSLVEQLDDGVRFLELDVHDDSFSSTGDYRVGHGAPGDQVMTGGGNPSTARLGAWLRVIADWSASHPTAAPLTLGLDLKDDLTDNRSFAEGNLAHLNYAVRSAFGDRLFTPSALGSAAWPPVDALRGRVLVVLSGHARSRLRYVQDVGQRPAVAVNAGGQVVEVHDSGSGTLWYWTGRRETDDRITWVRHGRYDTGQDPAVALTDDGWIVEVHQSESRAALFYHVGRLTPQLDIEWGPSSMYDDGVAPTVRFDSGDPRAPREIHLSGSTGLAWEWRGRLDTAARAVSWSGNARTSAPPFDETAERGITVLTRAGGDAPSDTLRYDSASRSGARIRYEPLMFVEYQPGNDADLERRFFAASNGSNTFARRWLDAGEAVRLWGFDEGASTGSVIPTFPATDEPFAPWYDAMCARVGCVR